MRMVEERLTGLQVQRPEPENINHEEPGSSVFRSEPVSPAATLDEDISLPSYAISFNVNFDQREDRVSEESGSDQIVITDAER